MNKRAFRPYEFSPLNPRIALIAALASLAVASVAGAARAESPAREVAKARSTDVPVPVRSTEPITVGAPPPLDAMHNALSDAFVTPIAAFDRLFFSEREEVETNQSYLRLITGTDWTNGEGFRFRSGVRARIRVPGLKARLNLLLNDEDDEATNERNISTRRRAISRDRAVNRLDRTARTDRTRAGVGYGIVRGFKTNLDLETALRSKARGEVALIVRQKFPMLGLIKPRATLTGFWLQGTGFGSRVRFNTERAFGERAILHWDNAVTQIHDVKGVVYDTRVSHDMQVTDISGVSPAFSVASVTRPVWRVDTYLLSVLYRRQFFRDWLFYELEPGVNWSRDDFGAYPPTYTTAFRVEVQFRRGEP